MAIGDLYEVKFRQTWGAAGKNLLNVFHYRQTFGDGGAEELATATNFYLSSKIAMCLSTQVKILWWEIINLDNPADYGIFDVSANEGVIVGDALPPYVCFSFRLNRSTRAVRNGQKRFAGVAEDVQANGIVTNGTQLTVLGELAVALGGMIDEDAGANVWYPRIYRAAGLNSKGQPVARADFPVSSVSYTGLSTQNTRK